MLDENKPGTTGHQWDDEEGFPLQEYNNPLPTWWLYSFYATIVFSVIYWIIYPAWPSLNDYTKGVLGWSMYGQLQEEMLEAQAQQKPFNDRLESLSMEEISRDPQLLQYTISGGKAIFGTHCASCHGGGGIGSQAGGFPILTDDDWLVSGTLQGIHDTIHDGRSGTMPAHLDARGGAFTAAQVSDLTQFVLSLSGGSSDEAAKVRGGALFRGEAGCNMCHGDAGRGSALDTLAGEPLEKSIGATNLADGIWLYGGGKETVYTTIANGRSGKMPAWSEGSEGLNRKLSPLALKQVTVYVHSLGGGV